MLTKIISRDIYYIYYFGLGKSGVCNYSYTWQHAVIAAHNTQYVGFVELATIYIAWHLIIWFGEHVEKSNLREIKYVSCLFSANPRFQILRNNI